MTIAPESHRSEGWRERLLSFATITAIAALVWNWASTQTRQTGEANCRIHFLPASAEAQSVGPADPITVRIQFSGSKAAVDAAVNAVNGRVFDVAVGTLGVPAEPGGHEIQLGDLLAQMPVVDESGAHVRWVLPASASIAIDAKQPSPPPK